MQNSIAARAQPARYHKVFQTDLETLHEMLLLFQEGWSSVALGKKYLCDHTSILYQVRKHGIRQGRRLRMVMPEKKEIIYYPLAPEPPKNKYDYLFDEDINQGKDYHEYVAERQQRKTKLVVPTPSTTSSSCITLEI